MERWIKVIGIALFVAGLLGWEEWIGYNPGVFATYPKPLAEVIPHFLLVFLVVFAIALWVTRKGSDEN
jgi:hypothetical protein